MGNGRIDTNEEYAIAYRMAVDSGDPDAFRCQVQSDPQLRAAIEEEVAVLKSYGHFAPGWEQEFARGYGELPKIKRYMDGGCRSALTS